MSMLFASLISHTDFEMSNIIQGSLCLDKMQHWYLNRPKNLIASKTYDTIIITALLCNRKKEKFQAKPDLNHFSTAHGANLAK